MVVNASLLTHYFQRLYYYLLYLLHLLHKENVPQNLIDDYWSEMVEDLSTHSLSQDIVALRNQ